MKIEVSFSSRETLKDIRIKDGKLYLFSLFFAFLFLFLFNLIFLFFT